MVDKLGRARGNGQWVVDFTTKQRNNEGDEAEVVAVWRLAFHLEEILGLCG